MKVSQGPIYWQRNETIFTCCNTFSLSERHIALPCIVCRSFGCTLIGSKTRKALLWHKFPFNSVDLGSISSTLSTTYLAGSFLWCSAQVKNLKSFVPRLIFNQGSLEEYLTRHFSYLKPDKKPELMIYSSLSSLSFLSWVFLYLGISLWTLGFSWV